MIDITNVHMTFKRTLKYLTRKQVCATYDKFFITYFSFDKYTRCQCTTAKERGDDLPKGKNVN